MRIRNMKSRATNGKVKPQQQNETKYTESSQEVPLALVARAPVRSNPNVVRNNHFDHQYAISLPDIKPPLPSSIMSPSSSVYASLPSSSSSSSSASSYASSAPLPAAASSSSSVPPPPPASSSSSSSSASYTSSAPLPLVTVSAPLVAPASPSTSTSSASQDSDTLSFHNDGGQNGTDSGEDHYPPNAKFLTARCLPFNNAHKGPDNNINNNNNNNIHNSNNKINGNNNINGNHNINGNINKRKDDQPFVQSRKKITPPNRLLQKHKDAVNPDNNNHKSTNCNIFNGNGNGYREYDDSASTCSSSNETHNANDSDAPKSNEKKIKPQHLTTPSLPLPTTIAQLDAIALALDSYFNDVVERNEDSRKVKFLPCSTWNTEPISMDMVTQYDCLVYLHADHSSYSDLILMAFFYGEHGISYKSYAADQHLRVGKKSNTTQLQGVNIFTRRQLVTLNVLPRQYRDGISLMIPTDNEEQMEEGINDIRWAVRYASPKSGFKTESIPQQYTPDILGGMLETFLNKNAPDRQHYCHDVESVQTWISAKKSNEFKAKAIMEYELRQAFFRDQRRPDVPRAPKAQQFVDIHHLFQVEPAPADQQTAKRRKNPMADVLRSPYCDEMRNPPKECISQTLLTNYDYWNNFDSEFFEAMSNWRQYCEVRGIWVLNEIGGSIRGEPDLIRRVEKPIIQPICFNHHIIYLFLYNRSQSMPVTNVVYYTYHSNLCYHIRSQVIFHDALSRVFDFRVDTYNTQDSYRVFPTELSGRHARHLKDTKVLSLVKCHERSFKVVRAALSLAPFGARTITENSSANDNNFSFIADKYA